MGTDQPAAEYLRLRHEHAQALTMLRIRKNDSRELEQLYRAFVFSELPERHGRHEDLANLIGTSVGEGLYITYHLLKSLGVPGDVCEFGVAQGATSRLLAQEIRHTDRKLWLFDSFQGLPKPSEKDQLIDDIFALGSMAKYEGTMRCQREEVEGQLRAVAFPTARVRIMPGWVEDTLRGPDLPANVAFAYVDFDFYNPIRETLRFLDDRMIPGARVIVDDYGFFSSGAKAAVDEFIQEAAGRFSMSLPLPAAGHFCILIRERD